MPLRYASLVIVSGIINQLLFLSPVIAGDVRAAAAKSDQTLTGVRLLVNHHVHEAVAVFERRLKENPRDMAALQDLAWAHLEEDQVDLAISELNRVIAIKPDFSLAYITRSQAFLEDNQIENAIKDCSSVLRISKDASERHEAYHLRGRIYRLQKEYSKSIADFDAAIKLTPKDPGILWNRGNVFFDIKEYQKAANDYSLALKYTPETDEDRVSRYLSSRAAAYDKLGNTKLAAEDRKRINYQLTDAVKAIWDDKK